MMLKIGDAQNECRHRHHFYVGKEKGENVKKVMVERYQICGESDGGKISNMNPVKNFCAIIFSNTFQQSLQVHFTIDAYTLGMKLC